MTMKTPIHHEHHDDEGHHRYKTPNIEEDGEREQHSLVTNDKQRRPVLHIEICLNEKASFIMHSFQKKRKLIQSIKTFFYETHPPNVFLDTNIDFTSLLLSNSMTQSGSIYSYATSNPKMMLMKDKNNETQYLLLDHVKEIRVCELSVPYTSSFLSSHHSGSSDSSNSNFLENNIVVVNIHQVELEIHIYKLKGADLHLNLTYEDEKDVNKQSFYDHNEYMMSDNNHTVNQEDQDSSMTTHHQYQLPCHELQGLWDSLIFDEQNSIPLRLLRFMYTAMLFGEKRIDPNLISWNKIALLYGPPGTGKTSLCKALAQKLSIRLSSKYKNARLLEINSHSLFSRYFSESGKLVMKMFQSIHDLIEDEHSFVCILIDEVESLTSARKSAASGNEPSDAIRVVNALLTQLDRLKTKPNVLIMTTSNMTNVIDDAFLDRADIRQFIGPPSCTAIYAILVTCIDELMKSGMIASDYRFVDWRAVSFDVSESNSENYSQRLYRICKKAKSLSGRRLRKLPFLVFVESGRCILSLKEFLNCFEEIIMKKDHPFSS